MGESIFYVMKYLPLYQDKIFQNRRKKMKMKKIICGIVAGVLAAFCMNFTVFAEPTDFEPSVSRAVQTNGKWGQSISYSAAEINAAGFTPDTTIEIEYELEGEVQLTGQHQVELILQNYEVEPQIWAQVVPTEYDDTHAVFDYNAMVLAYGSDDLSTVNNVCFGDRGMKLTVTHVKVTNYDPPVVETKPVEVAEDEAEEAETTKAEDKVAETTAVDTNSSAESSGNSVVLFIIIIAVVVVIAAVVVVIIVTKKSKKRFY